MGGGIADQGRGLERIALSQIEIYVKRGGSVVRCGVCGKPGDKSSLPFKAKVGKDLAAVCCKCAAQMLIGLRGGATSEPTNPPEKPLGSGRHAKSPDTPVATRRQANG